MTDETNRPDDEMIEDEEELQKLYSAARLFDVRRVIGGLFVVYGVIVTLLGFFDNAAEITKAQGVRINIWMGLGMLVFGLLMLLWLRLNPAHPPQTAPSSEAEGRGREHG
jgi:hypothetical protein